MRTTKSGTKKILNNESMKKQILLPVLVLGLAVLGAVYAFSGETSEGESARRPTAEPFVPSNTWNDYWYAGKAELSGYSLSQARYGEVHEGKAVLMFVTEDFSTKEHTKAAGKGVPVLKMNFDKKFLTGIYPYSMLVTAASPVDINRNPHAITVAGSVQEWCGHTFTQFNLEGDHYQMTEHSYFPGEGDRTGKIPVVWMEDEIWTRIRINPKQLPTGELEMMPGVFYLRLGHKSPEKVLKAKASLVNKEGVQHYTLAYQNGRTLSIEFEADFPHKILGWEESYPSMGGRMMITTAKLLKSTRLDYWSRNSNGDRELRRDLGFSPDEI